MGKMNRLICGTVLASVILGAFGYPSNQSPAEGRASSSDDSRQGKQFFSVFGIPHLFESELNLNLNTNGTPIIPHPMSINFTTNYDGEAGGTTSFVVPWHPFFLFPSAHPPLNFTVGVNAANKLDIALTASAGTNDSTTTGSLSTDVDVETTIGKRKATYLGNRPIGSSIMGDPKPVAHSRPNLNIQSPGVSVADAMQASTSIAEHQAGNHTFENMAVESVSVSKSPSSANDVTHVQFEQVHAAQAAVPATMENIAVPESVEAAVVEAPQVAAQMLTSNPAQTSSAVLMSSSLQQDKLKGKSRRHAGVERPTALRIQDFEDVENSESGIPHHSEILHEVTAYDSSKEEMILLAMEQAQQMVPGLHLSAPRPAPLIPGPINTVPLSVQPKPSPFAEERPAVSVEHVKHKPRPYGMDQAKHKPKGRPTLDGGMKEKDKEHHFGLPHASSSSSSSSSSSAIDFGIQKEQMESEGASVFGFQIPVMKWSTFTNVFHNILGSRKKSSMGKADTIGEGDDDSSKSCVDDEEEDSVSDLAKSPTITAGRLCTSPAAQSTCDTECMKNGYAKGTCLGPMTTPGCLCQMQNHKEYGMMLTPLQDSSPVREEPVRCKKCACADSCKRSHSYTGFCVDRCYCAVPWYKKEA